MDDGKRSVLTAVGLLVFVLLGVGSQRRSSSSSDGGITVTTTTVATTTASKTPDPTDAPDPTADYTSIDAAKVDGNKAMGKTLFIRVWRGTTEASSVTVYACGKGAGGFLNVKYALTDRALVKAIPPSLPMQGRCPRVVIKITGKEPYTSELKGELQQIMDLTPAEAEKLPAGVDYVSMDDVNIDGKKAAGKIVELKAYRSELEEKKFTAYTCGHAGGINFMYVTFGADQKEAAKDFTSSIMSCQTIKVKLTTQQPYSSTWNAQLVEVVKD